MRITLLRYIREVRPALLAAAIVAVPAALSTRSVWGPTVWAMVPAAAVAAGVLTRPERQAILGRTLVAAAAFGLATTTLGLLLYLLGAYVLALVPGSMVPHSESPLGYVVMTVITLVSIGPIVAVPMSLLGVIWVCLVRREGGRSATPLGGPTIPTPL